MGRDARGWAATDPVIGLLHDRTRSWAGATDAVSNASKTYARMPRHALPPPRALTASLSSVLAARRSARRLDQSRPISLGLLSQLLRWCVSESSRSTAKGVPARLYPSAGARYPLEVYVVARLIDGLDPGVYHWHPPTATLEDLPVSSETAAAIYERTRHPWHRQSAAILVVTGRRLLEEYGSRGYRFALLEAGAVLQNFGLVTTALGLAGSAIGTAWDDEIERLLGVDPEHEIALTAFAVGWRVSQSERSDEARAESKPALDDVQNVDRRSLVRPAAIVSLEAFSALPLWPGGTPPAMAVLRSAEAVLGLRLAAECPDELLQLPPEAWPVYPRLALLRQSGLRVDWHGFACDADEPIAHAYVVTVGESTRGAATDFASPAPAFAKAIGEAVERHVEANHTLSSEAVTASVRAIDGQAISLDSIAGYSTELRTRDAERLRWSGDTAFRWVRGTSLVTGDPRWLPLQLVGRVNVERQTGERWREPELRPRVTTGLAAHPDQASAVLHALREVIERDAFMLTWLARLPGQVFALADERDPRIAEMWSRFSAARLEPWAVRLVTDAPVSVVLGVIHDPSGVGPDVAVGAAANRDERAAIVAALTEAYAAWRWTRWLVATGHSCPEDTSALRLHDRAVWWAQRGRWESLRWLVEGPRIESASADAEPGSPASEIARLREWLREAGHEAVVVDLTDEAMAHRLGHHVVRVVVPGLHPLHLDEARPARWSQRLATVPRALGLPVPEELNPLPHPFP